MADKLKTSLNLDAELMRNLRHIAIAKNKSVTEELEESIKRHIKFNLEKLKDKIILPNQD